jgi:hypothetical protein
MASKIKVKAKLSGDVAEIKTPTPVSWCRRIISPS